MSEPISDAAFELRGACRHSLRFAFSAPLDYPYAPQLTTDNPPPAIFRRVQAASPPPGRDGGDWATGLKLDRRRIDPETLPLDRLTEVSHDDGVPSLDVPDPETVVLDQWITVPRRAHTVHFPGADHGTYLTSIRYWSPIDPGATTATRDVEFHDEFRMDWKQAPTGRWVAVSFDAFWPPERDSADLVIPIGDCDADCPS